MGFIESLLSLMPCGFPCMCMCVWTCVYACVLVCVCVCASARVSVKIVVVLTFSAGSILLAVLSSEWAQDLCVSEDM